MSTSMRLHLRVYQSVDVTLIDSPGNVAGLRWFWRYDAGNGKTMVKCPHSYDTEADASAAGRAISRASFEVW